MKELNHLKRGVSFAAVLASLVLVGCGSADGDAESKAVANPPAHTPGPNDPPAAPGAPVAPSAPAMGATRPDLSGK